VEEGEVNSPSKTNNAVGGGTLAAGVVLALTTIVSPTAWTFARTQDGDHNQTGYPAAAESELVVSVAVYNYAAVSEATLVKWEAETQRIFAKAGVEVGWRNCIILGKRVECPPRDHSLLAARIVLRILPSPMVKRLTAAKSEGGFATRCPSDVLVCHAYIFYDRAQDLVRDGAGVDLSQILSVMAAHEMGHLLLGADSHSRVGIMRSKWGPPDFQAAASGQVIFTAQQAEQLQAELRKRMALGRGRADAGEPPPSGEGR
jgi:hypothetical protein